MKKALFGVILVLFAFSCNQKPSADKLVKKFSKNSKKAFQITWTFESSGIINKDTSSYHSKAWAVYNETDTNWYGDVMVEDEAGNIGIYYKGQGFEYNKSRNRLTLYPQKYAKSAAEMNNNYFIKYLLNPEKLKKQIQDTTNKVSVMDTNFAGHAAWALRIQEPDGVDYHDLRRTYFFDKKSYNLLGIETNAYFIWDWLWNRIMVDSFSTDIDPDIIAQTLKDLQSKAKLDTMNIEEEEEEVYDLLQIGTLAPEVYGHVFQTKDTFVLSRQNAKLYVIDFWFQFCGACLHSIPYLIDLYNKYKDKGVLVIGVNSIDNNPQRYSYLKKFVKVKKITYPIIMTESKVDISYKVPGYPTVYVLDENRHIIYHEVGFNLEKKLQAIDSIVKARLQ